jgi:hypothetical protein
MLRVRLARSNLIMPPVQPFAAGIMASLLRLLVNVWKFLVKPISLGWRACAPMEERNQIVWIWMGRTPNSQPTEPAPPHPWHGATIMAVAGHIDRAMMEHYSHVRMAAKRDVLSKLESGLIEIPLGDRPQKPSQRRRNEGLRHNLRHKGHPLLDRLLCNPQKIMVGARGFEPPASWSRTKKKEEVMGCDGVRSDAIVFCFLSFSVRGPGRA